MRKFVMIFVSLLVIAGLLTVYTFASDPIYVNFDNFWDGAKVTLRSYDYSGNLVEFSAYFNDYDPVTTVEPIGDTTFSSKTVAGLFNTMYKNDPRAYLDFTLKLDKPDDYQNIDRIHLQFYIAIEGYRSSGFYDYSTSPLFSLYYFDNNGVTQVYNQYNAYMSRDPIFYGGLYWFEIDLDLTKINFNHFPNAITCSVAYVGKPAYDSVIGFGIASNSYIRYESIQDQIDDKAHEIGDDLDQAAQDLQVPSVSPDSIPEVELPGFSFQQFYSSGTFIPFMLTCALTTVSLSIVGYILFGKRD